MYPDLTPMRWPGSWQDLSHLALLADTGINCLLVEKNPALDKVVALARQQGIVVPEPGSTPPGVTIVPGEWPGLKTTRVGSPDTFTTGATGTPWVDSNGWRIRLAASASPGATPWLDAMPKAPRFFAGAYALGVADANTYGAHWIVSLDEQLVAGITAKNAEALATWKKIGATTAFFAAHKAWWNYLPEAVVGVVSDFSGANKFLSNELLNLLARTNEQYRVIPLPQASASSFSGLKALIYVDADPPGSDLRRQILAFVEAGGMLIAGPNWGQVPGAPAKYDDHPRFTSRVLGKGRIAIGRTNLSDPYLLANDSVVLIGHRYDLLRFWNAGSLASQLTVAPDRKRALVQLLFFTAARAGGPEAASIQVAGRYRKARLWTLDQAGPVDIHMEQQKEAVELHIPPVSLYVAIELES